MRAQLKQARLVMAGSVLAVSEHGSGRVAVAKLGVAKVLKGERLVQRGADIAVVEMRDLPTPPIFTAGARVVVFLRPARKTSFLAEVLPPGDYYELVEQRRSCLVAGSEAELKEITAVIDSLVAVSRKPARDAGGGAAAARTLVFQLLGSSHPFLVEDGAASLAQLRGLGASLTAREQRVVAAALQRADLPERVRLALIRAVAASGLSQVVPVLQDLQAPALQEAVWEALAELGAPPPVERLEDELAADDPSARAAAVRVLLRREGGDAVFRAAPVALRDPDKSVRLAAVEALGETESPQALPPLERVFAESDVELRQATARAILRIGGQPAADVLGRLAYTAPPDAQRYAVVLLMTIAAGKDDPLLTRIASEHPDEAVRRIVTHGLTRDR